MKEKAIALFNQLRAMWASLSTVKRIAFVTIATGVLITISAISFFGSQERYSYVFTDLNTEDASAIVEKLKELKIPHRVEAGGTAVQVPEARVHEIRLQLAGLGLPRGGGVGFELFDKSHFGATEFEQRLNYRRALEGELSRTIGNIGAVQSARVHLVLPERSVFTINKEEASASVILKLRPSKDFTKAEVASILHLVASAVPNLKPNNVSIVSTDGTALHLPELAGGAGALASAEDKLAEKERALALRMENHVKTMLERITGPGHAEVTVHVSLDQAVREKTEEHYEPARTALRSEQKTEERTGGGGELAGVAGVPGAQSNLPSPDSSAEPPPEPAPGGEGNSKSSYTRNWEVDRVTEKTSSPAGRVARISVGALVDGTYQSVDGAQKFIVRDKVELTRLQDLIKGAVGFDSTRGDLVQIECAQFARADEPGLGVPPVLLPPAFNFKGRPLWNYAAAGGGVAVLAAALLLIRRRKAKKAETEQKLLEAQKVQLKEKETEEEQLLIDATRGPLELPTQKPKTNPEEDRIAALDLAVRDPATAAIILREWLNATSESTSARF